MGSPTECLEQWLEIHSPEASSSLWHCTTLGQRSYKFLEGGERPRQEMRNVKVSGLLNGSSTGNCSNAFHILKESFPIQTLMRGWEDGIKAFFGMQGFKTFSLLYTFSQEAARKIYETRVSLQIYECKSWTITGWLEEGQTPFLLYPSIPLCSQKDTHHLERKWVLQSGIQNYEQKSISRNAHCTPAKHQTLRCRPLDHIRGRVTTSILIRNYSHPCTVHHGQVPRSTPPFLHL